MTHRAGSDPGPPGSPGVNPGGGPLVLSGGGSTLVATDAMFAQIELLQQMQADVTNWQGRLGRIQNLNRQPAPGWDSHDAGPALLSAAAQLEGLLSDSRSLGDRLVTAAEAYARTEAQAAWLLRQVGAVDAWLLGLLLPAVVVGATPALALAAVGALVGAWATGRSPAQLPAEFLGWLGERPQLLTNPLIVAVVRAVVDSADDFVGGRVGVPVGVSLGLGEDGLGVLGTATSAAGALLVARPFGWLTDGPITVTPAPVSGPTPAPPRTVADLAGRIPGPQAGAPQVRIERYGPADAPAWVVYIGGTVDWNLTGSSDPWDMASNIAAVAGQDGASVRAVVSAMRQAGIGPHDPVIEVGHSQGGMIAAQVAASGLFSSVLTATFGAPSGGPAATTPTVAVEHLDDLVPATGGVAPASPQRLLVRREAFQGRRVPGGLGLPAHAMAEYRRTAALIDASADPRLGGLAATLSATVGSAPGTTTLWVARRTPQPTVPGSADNAR
ncbi:MAG: hypothetical protein R6W83_03165 [Cryobacterium sp.]